MAIAALVVAGLICLLLAALVFAEWRKRRSQAAQARHWQSVEGTITQSEAAKVVAWTDVETGPVYLFEWKLAYRYTWKGQEKTSKRFSFSDPVRAKDEGGLRARLAAYPVGASTRVLVNPENPDEAVLDASTTPGFAILAGVLATGGLWLLWFSLH